MSKIFFYFLVFLIFITLTFFWLHDNPGYILISVGRKTYEMSFFVGLILHIFLILSILSLYKLFKILSLSKSKFSIWLTKKRKKEQKNNTTEGLIAYIEGNWLKAKKILSKSADNSNDPIVNFLFAARASSKIGDHKSVGDLLKKAELASNDPGLAIILTQAKLQFSNQQYEQCLATLLRVKKNSQHDPQILCSFVKVYDKLNDYDGLLRSMDSYRKYNIPFNKVIDQCAESAAINKLIRPKEGNIDTLKSWNTLPGYLKNRVSIIECCANQLIKRKKYNETEKFLRDHLKVRYDNRLLKIYSNFLSSQHEKQFEYISNLLKKDPSDVDLLRAAGSICLLQEKFEISEKYLIKSFRLYESVETAILLGRLYSLEKKYKHAVEFYQKIIN